MRLIGFERGAGACRASAALLALLLAPALGFASDLPTRRAPPEVVATGAIAPGLAKPAAPVAADEATPVVESRVAAGDEPPAIPEFLRRSGSRAGGPANELNTGDGLARAQLPEGSVGAMLAGRSLYHGNYCGPGNRGGAPTDALDAACQRHDACYTSTGHRSCGCDRALQRAALRVAATGGLARELRARAASVAEATPLMNCSEP